MFSTLRSGSKKLGQDRFLRFGGVEMFMSQTDRFSVESDDVTLVPHPAFHTLDPDPGASSLCP